MELPVISLWQPWATWIAWGWKTIETRGHDRFRRLAGMRLAIHAAQHFDHDAMAVAWPYLAEIADGPVAQRVAYPPSYYPKGVIVCTAAVENLGWLSPADSRAALCQCNSSRFGLWLGQVQQTPPIKIRGRQGIFYADVPITDPGILDAKRSLKK